MASASIVVTDSFPLIRLPRIHCKPLWSSLVFFASDTIAITITGTLVLWGSQGSGWGVDIHRYFALWPALGLFFVVFAYSDLYPGIIHNAVAELRRLAFGLTIGFLMEAGIILVTQSAVGYPRAVLADQLPAGRARMPGHSPDRSGPGVVHAPLAPVTGMSAVRWAGCL